MFENMKNIEIVYAVHGISAAKKTRYTQATGHSFSFKTLGSTIYTFGSEKYVLNRNEISFLPYKSTYYSERTGDEGSFSLITFNADIENPVPHIFHIDNPSKAAYIFDTIIKLSCVDTLSNRFEMLSLFYKLLALLSRCENNKNDISQRHLIEPALKYIENNIFNPDLEIGSLNTLCGISDTYFRRLFTTEFGMPPQKYITEKRLTQAKYLLDIREHKYIYEVSEAVGYSDSLYFSKIFKNRFGYSPSKNNI